ncbi:MULTISPECIES: serine aminopeptidase domain-containing protein [unclassified Kaistella]|uniref:alpha/beta hydrolase family protein n=1 Tax=unclassified Kaistella TaxID=2762626 RepID=UPI002733029E|nr:MULTISPECIES: alpha/beta hydrolase [unclassified Kaistella]MDP2454412.1 alpha/beta hydrolase [Kaistella sp. SH11-4b]MDP2457899.1 alpha/beta hydrolase [Kaistella sp. SH40-3]MDP2460805.1 alpha/beta hydrolase [Kaistella sp. SH19-2b]
MKELILNTSEQIPLSVKVFEPATSNKKLVLINSATGVKQQIYFSFAKYLAAHGFVVITYDYRGIGESKPVKMKGFDSSMRIWGTVDFKTLTDFIQKDYPEYTKFCLGHSVGALILGMNEYSKNFEKFIFVGTQDAYIGNLTFSVAVTALLGFGIALPVMTHFFSYFPAHRFGLGESLPKGVAFDWQTLILNKKSTSRLYEKIGENISKELTQKTFIIHAEDDTWVTQKGMRNLLKNVYPNLKTTYREVKVSESEKNEIGHVNFFRSYNQTLWKIVLDQL